MPPKGSFDEDTAKRGDKKLLGCASIAELDRSHVDFPGALA